MADASNGGSGDGRSGFWARYALTAAILSFPLAYGAVVLGVSPIAVGIVTVVSGVATLVIWDGLRWLPKSLMFWAKPSALQDESTGLFNLEAWKRMVEAEEDRAKRYDLPATVLVVKLHGRRDQRPTVEEAARMLQAGSKLGKVTRGHDILAVLAEDKLGILAVNCPTQHVQAFVSRVRGALDAEGIVAGYGSSDRQTIGSLQEAWSAADRAAEAADATLGSSTP